MSFSSKTKNDLARIKSEDKCCQKAELSALIRVSGTIQFKGLKKFKLTIMTENAAIARHIFTLFKKTFNTTCGQYDCYYPSFKHGKSYTHNKDRQF